MPNRPPPNTVPGHPDKKPHHGIDNEQIKAENAKVTGHDKRLQNQDEQGDSANVRQNTVNKGQHQSRR